MTAPASAKRSVSRTELGLIMARPETRILMMCVLMALIGIIEGFRSGWTSRALVLVAGAALSVAGAMTFAKTIASPERSIPASLSAMGGFAPYLFGCYLVFFRGFWNGRVIFSSFSIATLAVSVLFIYFGYRIVYWSWQLSEIAEAIRTGRLVVTPDVSPEKANGAS